MKKSVPVWTWMPGKEMPILCGLFTWDSVTRVGEFRYDQSYLASEHRIALDPVHLPLKRSAFKSVIQDGLFGVFADAGPDVWGRDWLVHRHGELDTVDILELSAPDGSGAILFGDADAKLSTPPPALQGLLDALANNDLSNIPRREREALLPTTSLGGAKPKFTVLHEEGEWILKLPEKNDSPYIAHNEHVMLEMAGKCGLNVCKTELCPLPDGKIGILIKRFDREDGSRNHYASAHTVLGLGDPRADNIHRKSYVRFSDELRRRWGRKNGEADARELWKRIVYNIMVGNGDDHTRNHGLLHDAESAAWKLSRLFDVVAAPKHEDWALAMSYHPGGAVVDLDALVEVAQFFGFSYQDAIDEIGKIAEIVKGSWREMLTSVRVPDSEADRLKSAFAFAQWASKHEYPPEPTRQRRRYGK